MWDMIRGYLTFTRKERYGVLFLLVLISILFVLPHFLGPAPGDRDPAADQKIMESIRKVDSGFRSPEQTAGFRPRYERQLFPYKKKEPQKPFTGTMFFFDPNTLDISGWQQLGLSERLSGTISRFREKGGRFRAAEDLQKIYGLRETDYQRLVPYVQIAKTPDRQPSQNSFPKSSNQRVKNYAVLDINQADSTAWASLPGIGNRLAGRIIHFREKLGGFYQVEQVGETFGLPDSSFKKMKSFLRTTASSIQLINLNTASKEELQGHPYIRWQVAREIIDYRSQHGNFQSVDQLLQLAQMDASKLEKLKPYLVVNH